MPPGPVASVNHVNSDAAVYSCMNARWAVTALLVVRQYPRRSTHEGARHLGCVREVKAVNNDPAATLPLEPAVPTAGSRVKRTNAGPHESCRCVLPFRHVYGVCVWPVCKPHFLSTVASIASISGAASRFAPCRAGWLEAALPLSWRCWRRLPVAMAVGLERKGNGGRPRRSPTFPRCSGGVGDNSMPAPGRRTPASFLSCPGTTIPALPTHCLENAR